MMYFQRIISWWVSSEFLWQYNYNGLSRQQKSIFFEDLHDKLQPSNNMLQENVTRLWLNIVSATSTKCILFALSVVSLKLRTPMKTYSQTIMILLILCHFIPKRNCCHSLWRNPDQRRKLAPVWTFWVEANRDFVKGYLRLRRRRPNAYAWTALKVQLPVRHGIRDEGLDKSSSQSSKSKSFDVFFLV